MAYGCYGLARVAEGGDSNEILSDFLPMTDIYCLTNNLIKATRKLIGQVSLHFTRLE